MGDDFVFCCNVGNKDFNFFNSILVNWTSLRSLIFDDEVRVIVEWICLSVERSDSNQINDEHRMNVQPGRRRTIYTFSAERKRRKRRESLLVDSWLSLSLSCSFFVALRFVSLVIAFDLTWWLTSMHTHTHTHWYMYIHIYVRINMDIDTNMTSVTHSFQMVTCWIISANKWRFEFSNIFSEKQYSHSICLRLTNSLRVLLLFSKWKDRQTAASFNFSFRFYLKSKSETSAHIEQTIRRSRFLIECTVWYRFAFHYLFDVICSTNYQVEQDDIELSMIGRKENRFTIMIRIWEDKGKGQEHREIN